MRFLKKLEESNLVDKCYKIARNYGKGRTDVESCYTKLKYEFNGNNLKIELYDGWTMFGGGDIKVFYNEELVLYGDRYALDKKGDIIAQCDGVGILKYKNGAWEKEVEKILNPPVQEEKPIQKKDKNDDVSEEKLKLFRERYE